MSKVGTRYVEAGAQVASDAELAEFARAVAGRSFTLNGEACDIVDLVTQNPEFSSGDLRDIAQLDRGESVAFVGPVATWEIERVRPPFMVETTDPESGMVYCAEGDSLEALSTSLREQGYEGPSLRVVDVVGFTVGWVSGSTWSATSPATKRGGYRCVIGTTTAHYMAARAIDGMGNDVENVDDVDDVDTAAAEIVASYESDGYLLTSSDADRFEELGGTAADFDEIRAKAVDLLAAAIRMHRSRPAADLDEIRARAHDLLMVGVVGLVASPTVVPVDDVEPTADTQRPGELVSLVFCDVCEEPIAESEPHGFAGSVVCAECYHAHAADLAAQSDEASKAIAAEMRCTCGFGGVSS